MSIRVRTVVGLPLSGNRIQPGPLLNMLYLTRQGFPHLSSTMHPYDYPTGVGPVRVGKRMPRVPRGIRTAVTGSQKMGDASGNASGMGSKMEGNVWEAECHPLCSTADTNPYSAAAWEEDATAGMDTVHVDPPPASIADLFPEGNSTFLPCVGLDPGRCGHRSI